MANLNIKPDNVLLRPRVTEKAALAADKSNVYVFEVAYGANKKAISASVKSAYGVTPIRVRVLNLPAKKVFVRGLPAQAGKQGVKGGIKKAYVSLKKGDKIELI